MANFIFVAGLDYRGKSGRKDEKGNIIDDKADYPKPFPPGDLNLAQQTEKVKKGFNGTEKTADVVSFRYNDSNTPIFKAIKDNPGAPIMLFSAGCQKCLAIANYLKSLNRPLTLLHINEPYSCSAGTKNTVDKAIELGVPKKNVYSGGSDCTGANIDGATKVKGRTDHFQSCTPVTKLIIETTDVPEASTIPTTTVTPVVGSPSVTGPIVGSPSVTMSTTGSSGSSGSTPQNQHIAAPANVSGKAVIKVKSGPNGGEITGVTELPLIPYQQNGEEVKNFFELQFNELQFTEPGDYVLILSTDSPDIETLELNVKVSALKEPIEQQRDKDVDDKAPAGSRPIISQIDPPTIKIKPITYKQDIGGVPGQTNITAGYGFLPVVYYLTYQIKHEDIQNMEISNEDLLPKLDLTFKDSLNFMKGDGTPKDQTYIDVFLDSTSRDLKFVHLVFKINNFEKEQEKPDQKYSITGVLNIPELFIQDNKSYEGTSFEVLRQICKELGLGFNSNITATNDKMTWVNSNKSKVAFMQDIILHSYIDDKAYMVGYIDFYYCFNFVDVNKEFTRDNKADQLIDTSPSMKLGGQTSKMPAVPALLTNDNSQSSSSLYIMKYETENLATEVAEEQGYRTKARFYDRIKKKFLEFFVDSQSSDGRETTVLKGPENDTKLLEKNTKNVFLGKLDSFNTHMNHKYARVQNKINLGNLTKIGMQCTLPTANFSIYKYMKIKTLIVNKEATATEDGQNYAYSGDYILWDIKWQFAAGKLSQELQLFKSELGKSPTEKKEKKPKPRKETKEKTTNPAGASPSVTLPPNARYTVGDVYIVEDKNKNKFKITIKEVLSNGIEVIANLTEIEANFSSNELKPTSNDTVASVTQAQAAGTTGSTPEQANGQLIQSSDQTGSSQSTAEKLIEKNKSQTIDVLKNGSFKIDVNVTDIIKTGKISTDDIEKLAQGENNKPRPHVVFKMGPQVFETSYKFTTSNVEYKQPDGTGVGQRVDYMTNSEAVYDIYKNHLYENSDLIGNYKIDIYVNIVDEKKPADAKDKYLTLVKRIEFNIEKGLAPASTTTNNPEKTNYIIGVLNPTTPEGKNLTGNVNIQKNGTKFEGSGDLSGFPDGQKIVVAREIEGAEILGSNEDNKNKTLISQLKDDIIRALEIEITVKYKTALKLVVLDKK